MKLKKSLRINGKMIPAGTTLTFGTEGYATIAGVRVHESQIPAVAIERQGSVLAKSIRLGNQTIAAGTELFFNEEGVASFEGQDISIYQIPSRAFVGATESDMHENANNAVDTEKQFKDFDALEPGDMGIGQDGEAVRFLGKAVGKAGYDALVGQFGNASGKDFEEITVGMSDDEINEAQFVAYTIPDGTVCVGRYGADYVVATAATESEGEFIDASEVVSGDAGVDADGKPVTIIAKGDGSVWYKKMLDALKLDCHWKEIAERLGVEEDDDMLKNSTFVVFAKEDGEKCIDIYGSNGVKVFAEEA